MQLYSEKFKTLYTFEPSDNLSLEENYRLSQLCIVVINVQRSTRRLDLMKKQLKPLNIHTFIFEAVDAADISILNTDHSMLKIIQYGNTYYMIDYTRRFDYHYRGELPKGMIACSLSHQIIYSNIVFATKFKHYLILEDDATVLLDAPEMRKYLANLPDSYEMIYLNSESKWFPIEYAAPINNYYSWIQKKDFNASVSYLLNSIGAGKLLTYIRHAITRPPDDL